MNQLSKVERFNMNHVSELLIPIMERLDRIEESLSKNQISNLMTIRQIEVYSQLSGSTIMRHIKRGTLKPFKDTGKKLFRKDDVDRWLSI